MGVDVGVCKYIPEREEKLARLEILRKLPGEEGERYDKEIDEIYENEIWKEDKQFDKVKELEDYIGNRMHNLWYEVNTGNIQIEFSFYREYRNTRVPPNEILRILTGMKSLLYIADSDMKSKMKRMIRFFTYILENNLMIYPC